MASYSVGSEALGIERVPPIVLVPITNVKQVESAIPVAVQAVAYVAAVLP